MPEYIADQYYIHFQDNSVITDGNKLIDYYIQASDNFGNIKKSPVQHTFIGDENNSIQNSVDWFPEDPTINNQFTVYYDANIGNLDTPIYIHLGYNNWTEIITPDPLMTYNQFSQKWEYSFIVPSNSEQINFVFNDGQNNWDNNNGNDWNINVQNILLGDVNFDSMLDILDLVLIVSFILDDNVSNIDADFNNDGNINLLDIVYLVNLIIND